MPPVDTGPSVPPVKVPPVEVPPVEVPGGGRRPDVLTRAGADTVARQLMLRNAELAKILQPEQLKLLQERLPGLLQLQPIPPGSTVPPVAVVPDALTRMLQAGIVTAAGLDPARTPSPAPPVLWEDGDAQLLVELAGVSCATGDGWIEVRVPVRCDEVGEATVSVTFVTGSAERSAGLVAATEDHPRGPAAVVERWHEPLIALAWHALVEALRALAGTSGTDLAGRPLVPVSVAVSPNGVQVLPMGRLLSDRWRRP